MWLAWKHLRVDAGTGASVWFGDHATTTWPSCSAPTAPPRAANQTATPSASCSCQAQRQQTASLIRSSGDATARRGRRWRVRRWFISPCHRLSLRNPLYQPRRRCGAASSTTCTPRAVTTLTLRPEMPFSGRELRCTSRVRRFVLDALVCGG
ncbi:MAG: DUF4913 domain-containing protein [Actinobacteria bacterium]|nr:DUF4913 domain-containing protein [Actinomycetota bacterium]